MSAFAKCVYLGKQSLQTCFYRILYTVDGRAASRPAAVAPLGLGRPCAARLRRSELSITHLILSFVPFSQTAGRPCTVTPVRAETSLSLGLARAGTRTA